MRPRPGENASAPAAPLRRAELPGAETHRMRIPPILKILPAIGALFLAAGVPAQQKPAPPGIGPTSGPTWWFAVSGDSRNCGDVVMPGIAAGVQRDKAEFYWHLGDLRAIYNFDEDILHQPAYLRQPPSISTYLSAAWPDFIRSQIEPFGATPFFLGIGNHETTPPKTRADFLIQFADWLDSPELRAQRLKDDSSDHMLRAYFHWIQNGVDFINLDNATADQFDAAQMAWFERVLQADAANSGVTSIVVGMHEALPDSIAWNHSMNQFVVGIASGRRAYADLLKAQNEAHKHVYVLASHSHYYMGNIFNTAYWHEHGGVLPGWIVGTGGAIRYPLPPDAANGLDPQTNVYGYLLGQVQQGGEIRFEFRKLEESDIPAAVVQRYDQEFVHWCFARNFTTAQP